MASMPQSDVEGGDATAGNVVVLGVDTHKDIHVAVVISALGVFLASQSFPRNRYRIRAMLAWARTFGTVQQAGVECTGSYGGTDPISADPSRFGHRDQPAQGRAVTTDPALRESLSRAESLDAHPPMR